MGMEPKPTKELIMFFLVNNSNNLVINSGQAASISEFKSMFPIPSGETASNFEYFEWPDDLSSDSFVLSTDGSTAGITAFGSVIGATLSAGLSANNDIPNLVQGEMSAYLEFVSGITNPASLSISGDELFLTPSVDINQKRDEQEKLDEVHEEGFQVDPRLNPDILLSDLQVVKDREADNSFLEDGLGATASVQFELDDGSDDTLVFDSRKKTVLDLIAIKNYSDLNQSLIDQSTQTAVSVTGIQTIDDEGTIKQLSPTEFDRMLYSLLQVFYENYTARVDMKNEIQNPTGSTDAEKITFLNNATNISFSTSLGSSFVSVSSGK